MSHRQLLMILVLMMLFPFQGGSVQTVLAMGSGAQIPRTTIEELKAKLGQPEVIILDVRLGEEWTGSKMKIKGAIREDPEKIQSWADKYPKDKTVVLYCS